QADVFGRALWAYGLRPGDVIVIHGRHCLESVIAIAGCAWAGVAVALLPHMFSTEQIAGTLDNSSAKLLVALGEEAEVRRAALACQRRGLAALVVGDGVAVAEGAGPRAITWSSFVQSANLTSERRQPRSADDLVLLLFSSGTKG